MDHDWNTVISISENCFFFEGSLWPSTTDGERFGDSVHSEGTVILLDARDDAFNSYNWHWDIQDDSEVTFGNIKHQKEQIKKPKM